jgi:hypothetical protein
MILILDQGAYAEHVLWFSGSQDTIEGHQNSNYCISPVAPDQTKGLTRSKNAGMASTCGDAW